jgi:Flp pilus assembly protein TadB
LPPKLIAGALSPYWAVIGAAGAVLGWAYLPIWAIPMGILGAGMMIWYVWQCTRDHQGFEYVLFDIPVERIFLRLEI